MENVGASLNPVWLALIVGIPPLLVLLLNRWWDSRGKAQEAEIKLKEKQEDYARQDKVADRQEAAALKAAEAARSAGEAARLMLESNTQVVAKTELVSAQVDVVHTLVNSDRTAVKQDTLKFSEVALAATQLNLTLLKKIGEAPEPEMLNAISTMKTKIEELKIEIDARLQQQKQIDEVNKIKAGYQPEKPA